MQKTSTSGDLKMLIAAMQNKNTYTVSGWSNPAVVKETHWLEAFKIGKC